MSMHDAGFRDHATFLFAEPNSTNVDFAVRCPVHLSLVTNPEKMGNFRNWNNAARTLLRHTADPWIMICEDDITWAGNAMEVLEYDLPRFNMGKCGAISLYCPDRMASLISQQIGHQRLQYGYHACVIGKKMWGAQALVFRREWLEQIIGHPFWADKLSDPAVDKNVDAWVAETIYQQDKRLAYRIPCLVDHVLGDQNSTLYGDKDRPNLRTHYFKERA